MSSRFLTALTCASLVASIVVLSAQDGMNKPLAKFTIGDLFPKVSLPLKETSVAWKAAADSARALAVGRTKDIQVALSPMKDQVDKAKDEAKAAEKAKDFAAAGVADGKVKTGSIVVGLLERLKDIGSRQEDMATAWSSAADQM